MRESCGSKAREKNSDWSLTSLGKYSMRKDTENKQLQYIFPRQNFETKRSKSQHPFSSWERKFHGKDTDSDSHGNLKKKQTNSDQNVCFTSVRENMSKKKKIPVNLTSIFKSHSTSISITH